MKKIAPVLFAIVGLLAVIFGKSETNRLLGIIVAELAWLVDHES